MCSVSIVDRKEEDGWGYCAFVGFAVGYGTHADIQYTIGWHLEGAGVGFRFGEICGFV